MRVISQKGKGSTFAFMVCKQASNSEIDLMKSQQPTTPSSTKSRHILVVEDNPINQKIMSKYLEQLGHSCEVANNGLKRLNLIKYARFDIVFMDVEMSVMGGLESTKKIREWESQSQARKVPVVR